MEIGEPIKRWTVVPLTEPVQPTHEPTETPLPTSPASPAPTKVPETEPA